MNQLNPDAEIQLTYDEDYVEDIDEEIEYLAKVEVIE